MRKIFNILGIAILTIFSFYYTNKMTEIVKKKDPIMIEIMEEKDQLEVKSVNATIDDFYIIPGVSGLSVDVDKSYYKMKKLGEYNENLYMFINEEPKISIKNIYDKFIISGNKNKNQISLIFKIDEISKLDYVYKIVNILNNNEVVGNFFIDGKIIENNLDILKNINEHGNFLGNYGYDNKYDRLTIKYTNSLIEKFTFLENGFCLVEEDDYEVLDICSNLNMYTIKSTSISSTNNYSDIKNNLQSGGIYTLKIDEYTIKNLSILIKYIKHKGYEIVKVDELISE